MKTKNKINENSGTSFNSSDLVGNQEKIKKVNLFTSETFPYFLFLKSNNISSFEKKTRVIGNLINSYQYGEFFVYSFCKLS